MSLQKIEGADEKDKNVGMDALCLVSKTEQVRRTRCACLMHLLVLETPRLNDKGVHVYFCFN